MTRTRRALLAALTVSSLTAARLEAVVPPKGPAAEKEFRHPNLHIPTNHQSLDQLDRALAGRVEKDIAALGIDGGVALYDARAGRIGSLIVSVPLVPGTGVGNELRWLASGGQRPTEAAMKEHVWAAVVGYLRQNAGVLRVDTAELGTPRIAVLEGGDIIQVFSPRVVNGIKVRESSLTAVLNHGNLVLLGLTNWGDFAPGTLAAAQISADQVRSVVAQHLQPNVVEGWRKDAELEYVPMVKGDGYEYRLVLAQRLTVRGDAVGTWEGLVDAASGELIAFQDHTQYAARKVIGGVYPVSNDQVPPDGVEQAGWPMPFLRVTTPAGVVVTNSGGTIGCATGSVSTALQGTYLAMTDTCGAANEISAAGDIDLGFGPTPTATDCAVPVGHSAGDTKSSRSGFYELNRIAEQGRGYLPNNTWLNSTLTANMNIIATCNASWNGAVNFFRSGGVCANTGEIAAVFDHEWGHGMDANGVNPNIANPGEGIADVHSILRLNNSCMGRNFRPGIQCPGYGDACTSCTGVRDTNWANRVSGVPHGLPWIDANCGGGPAPCGGGVHCEGAVVGESGWDLFTRDFRGFGGSVFNYDLNTALELSTRLFLIGSGPVTQWFQCTNPNGGCLATAGYLQLLAVDDDNGNLNDGTPHMTAIHAAFNRHNIACGTPAPVNSGCAGGPTAAPVLTVVPQDQGARLTWTAVAGATRYYVYRTEGVNGADFGKVKIAEVTGTTYVDANTLQNGRQYFYNVWPVGTSSSCFGLMSNSVTTVPVAGGNLTVRPTFTYTRTGGDNDEFLDNCETANVTITVENTGTGPLTNVRLVGVTFLTHPTSVLQTTLPAPIAPTLADCASANGTFAFTLNGATQNQVTDIRVEVTADQLGGQNRSQVISIANLENDAVTVPTRTYNFDTDYSGWTVLPGGTFNRLAGGAQGTPFHLSSSGLLPDQCDVVRSPAIVIKANSTLALYNRFEIEPTDPTAGPYDRANVGLRTVDNGLRTPISPSGGQLYTTIGTGGTGTYTECELTAQPGWNGTSPGFPATFNESTWSSAAMNPGGVFTGRVAHIEIRYGTDPGLHLAGFDFDQVVATNFDELVPDTLPNVCIAQAVAPFAISVDSAGNGVYQPNETAVVAPTWRNIGTSAITLAGAFSNHTGPAGPTYSIPDATADYGTIPVNGNQSCGANCYSVANVVATRPQLHWDSTVLETVNPSGTTKTWTLHVGNSFAEVPPTSPFFRFIEMLLHRGVTGGCTATNYCPSSSTTREQMAVFVILSKEPPGYVPPACVAGSTAFLDVPATSPFCRWIEELARRGVVSGCGGGNYCPSAPVTREQMAVFVLRTLDPALTPPACVPPNTYGDVPETSPFCRWIEELTARGVVTGCGGGNYCPAAPVTREQMGVFLAVTFALSLYGL